MRDGPRSSRGVRPSIASVARRAGVSIATVSRVVNGVANKASPETVARVREVIAELGYRPTSAGQALRRRESRLVAVLAANLANPTMAAIAASIETALRAEGLVMVLCDTHDRPELQDEYLLEMRAHQVRATVFLGAVASPGLAEARQAGEALLFVGRRCPTNDDAPFVGIDNARAGADVAAFLLRSDVDRLAVIHGSLSSSATADRVAGFLAGVAAFGLPPGRVEVVGDERPDHLELGYAAMERLLEAAPPRGVFCSSDLIAFGAHRRLLEAGLASPEDVTFVGFDDNPLNPWVAPWLNSVRVPYEEFGRAVAQAVPQLGIEPSPVFLFPHTLNARRP
jgi:LacI family transcriptional regulator